MLHLAAYISGNINLFKRFIFIISLIPLVNLLYKYQTNLLGINPFNTVVHTTGHWALMFLLITLTITPLRRVLTQLMIILNASYGKRLSDWNFLIKVRRMLGLYVFFYAALHLSAYLYLEMNFDLEEIIWDIKDRPFIAAGISAFILLLPLVVTSNNNMIRRLKKNWRRIHRLIYPIAIIAIIHYWWLSKVGVYAAAPYSIFLTILLGYRLIAWFTVTKTKPLDDGMEVAERKK